jgi:acyl CoA:acetate/3-ketoacid CoA transferase alpha subunit
VIDTTVRDVAEALAGVQDSAVVLLGGTTVAQVQHLRALGEIDPDHITTPGIFVQHVLHLPYGHPPF